MEIEGYDMDEKKLNSKAKKDKFRHTEKTPLVATNRENENLKTLLEFIDREISFYRKRAGQIYFLGFLIEGLILVGEQKVSIPNLSEVFTIVLHILLFIAIGSIGRYLGLEYRNRVHILKDSRLEILVYFGYKNVFPTPLDKVRSEIKTLYTLLISLSVAGVLINLIQFIMIVKNG